MVKILIGIPSYCRPQGLRRLLSTLAAQQGIASCDVEVFVADNDARQRQAAAACKQIAPEFRFPLACEVVEERGISAARNAILDRARECGADYVAMIDDDEVAEPNWLSKLLAMQKQTGAHVVGGPVESLFETEPPTALRQAIYFNRPKRAPGAVSMIDGTGNVLLSCVALSDRGWPNFDLAFGLTGGGDKEFFTRLRKAGFTFAWAPSAITQELVPPSRSNAGWVLRRAFRIGNSDQRITELHDGPKGAVISLGKAVAVLVSAPLCVPILLIPNRRLWLMTKWSRAAGKITALVGGHYHEYSIGT